MPGPENAQTPTVEIGPPRSAAVPASPQADRPVRLDETTATTATTATASGSGSRAGDPDALRDKLIDETIEQFGLRIPLSEVRHRLAGLVMQAAAFDDYEIPDFGVPGSSSGGAPDASHFDVLEIDPDATDREVTRAYRRLARKHHPDKDSSAAATETMQKINASYEAIRKARSRPQADWRC